MGWCIWSQTKRKVKDEILSGNECLCVHLELNSNSSGQVGIIKLMLILMMHVPILLMPMLIVSDAEAENTGDANYTETNEADDRWPMMQILL